MEKAAYTKKQLMAYDKFKIDLLTEAAMLDEAEEKGEKKNQMKTIENCVRKGFAIEIIADITGLSTTQVTKIIEEINSS